MLQHGVQHAQSERIYLLVYFLFNKLASILNGDFPSSSHTFIQIVWKYLNVINSI